MRIRDPAIVRIGESVITIPAPHTLMAVRRTTIDAGEPQSVVRGHRMDEPVPLQLASMNRMEVVAIHMIHLYRDPPGSRRGTGVGTDPVPASIAMAVSMHDGFMPSS